MNTLAAAAAIVVVGAVAQAVTGFGFSLVSIPLLALVTDARTAVVGLALPAILLNVTTVVRERRHVRWRPAGLLITAATAGMPFGLVLLHMLTNRALTMLIAVVVLACTALVWREPRLGSGTGVVIGAGLVTGVLTTATCANGPPLVAAFRSMGYPPRQFRATLAAIFAASGAAGAAGFGFSGQYTHASAAVSLVAIPSVGLGWLAGNQVFRRVREAHFRSVLLTALVVSSVLAVAKALTTS